MIDTSVYRPRPDRMTAMEAVMELSAHGRRAIRLYPDFSEGWDEWRQGV